jgi:hypothetical protein
MGRAAGDDRSPPRGHPGALFCQLAPMRVLVTTSMRPQLGFVPVRAWLGMNRQRSSPFVSGIEDEESWHEWMATKNVRRRGRRARGGLAPHAAGSRPAHGSRVPAPRPARGRLVAIGCSPRGRSPGFLPISTPASVGHYSCPSRARICPGASVARDELAALKLIVGGNRGRRVVARLNGKKRVAASRPGGVPAWRRRGPAASRRRGVAAWRRRGVAASRRRGGAARAARAAKKREPREMPLASGQITAAGRQRPR